MEILYISSVPSNTEFYTLKERLRNGINETTYGMSEAGFKFHSLIQSGLNAQNDTHIYSLVGRSICLKTHKGIIWKVKKEELNGIQYKHLTVIALPLIKQLVMGILFFFNTLKWLIETKNKDEKYIIMDGAYVTVIPFVMFANRFFKCKTAGVFADIYEYMGNVTNDQAKHRIVSKVLRQYISKCYDNLDGFVLITEQANNIVNRCKKPYIVMEGLVNIEMKNASAYSVTKENPKVILYAGALREKYGLKNLLDGFMMYKNNDVCLEVYGEGDFTPEIQKAAEIDPRIRFMGLLGNDEIVKREMQATLLVNPRPVNQEFTQYSFPSKNMEYMVSGTPVLTTRLPGMPEEYYDYVFTIDGDTAEDVTKALESTFLNSQDDLNKKGQAAMQFVLEHKNNVTQAARITGLLKSPTEKSPGYNNIGIRRNSKFSVSNSKLLSFFAGNNDTELSFQFLGIMRYVPLIICGGFFAFSILLFAFGPLDWHIKNGMTLYGFLSACLVALSAGYILAVMRGKTSNVKVKINVNRLFVLCTIVFFAIYIPTVYSRTGKLYPDIYTGLSNAGLAYKISKYYSEYGPQTFEYIRIILGPFIIMVMPVTLFFMPKLSKTWRILGIFAIVLTAFLGISQGINKYCADITAQIIIYLALLFFSKKVIGKNLKHKMKTLLLITLACGMFFSYYTVTMRSRVAMDRSIAYASVADSITPNNTSGVVVPENPGTNAPEINGNVLNASLNQYSTMGYATEKENYMFFRILPDNLKSSALYLSSYVTHGYKGLSIAMNQDFTSTYGLGFSQFFRHNFEKIFGSAQAESRIEQMTYAGKTSNEGWVTGAVWSSFFVFPASDITFLGTVLLIFIIGYYWALSWKDALKTHNPFAIAVFFNFCIMVFYFPANNQLFQGGESCIGFTAVLFVWLFTRWRGMKKGTVV